MSEKEKSEIRAIRKELARLRPVVEAALAQDYIDQTGEPVGPEAQQAFWAACSPERILALLARVDKLEAALRLTYGGPLPLTANDRAQIEAALADAEVTK